MSKIPKDSHIQLCCTVLIGRIFNPKDWPGFYYSIPDAWPMPGYEQSAVATTHKADDWHIVGPL